MSTTAVETNFSVQQCDGKLIYKNDHDIVVKAKIKDNVKGDIVHYVAAAPANHRASFTGSGLPFHNQRQAFDNTPNSGSVRLHDNMLQVQIKLPNSYYAGLGTVIIPPTLYIHYTSEAGEDHVVNIPISKGIPYRMLTYPMQFTRARHDATFYAGGWEMPVRSQEQILRDSAYPPTNHMAPNFWGGKPPS